MTKLSRVLLFTLLFSFLAAPSPTRAEEFIAFGTEKSLVLDGRSSRLIWRNKHGVEIYSEELRERVGQYKVSGRMFWQFQGERLTGWGKVVLNRRGGPETREFLLEVYKELARRIGATQGNPDRVHEPDPKAWLFPAGVWKGDESWGRIWEHDEAESYHLTLRRESREPNPRVEIVHRGPRSSLHLLKVVGKVLE